MSNPAVGGGGAIVAVHVAAAEPLSQATFAVTCHVPTGTGGSYDNPERMSDPEMDVCSCRPFTWISARSIVTIGIPVQTNAET